MRAAHRRKGVAKNNIVPFAGHSRSLSDFPRKRVLFVVFVDQTSLYAISGEVLFCPERVS